MAIRYYLEVILPFPVEVLLFQGLLQELRAFLQIWRLQVRMDFSSRILSFELEDLLPV